MDIISPLLMLGLHSRHTTNAVFIHAISFVTHVRHALSRTSRAIASARVCFTSLRIAKPPTAMPTVSDMNPKTVRTAGQRFIMLLQTITIASAPVMGKLSKKRMLSSC